MTDVTGRAGGVGAAADAALRGVERGDTGFQRGDYVGEALAAGVVEVGGVATSADRAFIGEVMLIVI